MPFSVAGSLLESFLIAGRQNNIREKQRDPTRLRLASRQLFIRVHNETLSVAAMCVGNPDCSPLGIDG